LSRHLRSTLDKNISDDDLDYYLDDDLKDMDNWDGIYHIQQISLRPYIFYYFTIVIFGPILVMIDCYIDEPQLRIHIFNKKEWIKLYNKFLKGNIKAANRIFGLPLVPLESIEVYYVKCI
jgi:hypothetical protein